jgi:histidine triad (HIT) family protein
MDDCVFCKIVKGEVPSDKVYENADFMAFLDIAPVSRGQVLVIPKKHYRWTWDVPNFGNYWEVAQKVAKAAMAGLNVKMVEFLTHGMDVEHAHIWVVPIYGNEAYIKADKRLSFSNDEMKKISDIIEQQI